MTATFGGPAEIEPFTPKPTFVFGNPRTVVMINGSPYLPIKWETVKNGHGATDSATVTLALGNNPDFSIELFKGQIQNGSQGAQNLGLDPNSNPAAVDTTPVYVQIFAGYPKNPTPGSKSTQGMLTRFLGIVDAYSFDEESLTVTFTCRSLAAPLVDNKR